MKKILYIITKSNWGGAQRYVFDLATNLPHGYEPVVALGGDGTLEGRLREKNIRTVRADSLRRDLSLVKELRAFFELLRIARAEAPAVIHLNSSKAGALGALAARCAGVPRIVFTAHGWPFKEARALPWRALAWLASWATALLAHAVICVCEEDFVLAKRMPFIPRKAVLIHNGIDLSMPFGTGEAIRAAFPPNVHITGTIGELTANKNQTALIEAAAEDPNMHVAIVGDGEDATLLDRMIQEKGLEQRVKRFGFMPAFEVLKGFDTFALPSKKEGLPYVLLEAKLAGLPLRANPVGGVPDILSGDIREFSLERMVARTQEQYAV